MEIKSMRQTIGLSTICNGEQEIKPKCRQMFQILLCGCCIFLQIEHGANIDARDISDATPLLFAAAEGLTEIIQVILDKGRQINIVEEEIKK